MVGIHLLIHTDGVVTHIIHHCQAVHSLLHDIVVHGVGTMGAEDIVTTVQVIQWLD
jgi:hypothetical protein